MYSRSIAADVFEGSDEDCQRTVVSTSYQPDRTGDNGLPAGRIRGKAVQGANYRATRHECRSDTSRGCRRRTAMVGLAFRRKSLPEPHNCPQGQLRHGTTLALLTTLTSLCTATTLAQMPDLSAPHRPGYLLVRFDPEASDKTIKAVNDELGAVEVHRYRYFRGLLVVRVTENRLAHVASGYLRSPHVRYAEPDYLLADETDVNDPGFSEQWGMHNVGQLADCDQGTPRSDMRAAQAWEQWTGDGSLLVAVIDSHGVAYDHPDLEPNIWTNPNEIPGDGQDNDDNLCIDDVHGCDFADGDGDPFQTDNVSHATRISGIIAARGGNEEGIAGLNWFCQVVPIRVFGSAQSVCMALDYVIANDIKVSSNSYGIPGSSQALCEAIETARTEIGHIFVASAGNGGADNDLSPHFPSNCPSEGVIAVAATTTNDQRWRCSNYGQNKVDVGAPGVAIYSTTYNFDLEEHGYGFMLGTSMAAPHVAGLATLVWTRFPNMDPDPVIQSDMVIDQIFRTVRPLDDLDGKTVTGGIVNAWAAVADYNENTIPDAQEISANPSLDCDGNGNWILDQFEPDCHAPGEPGHGSADSCDIANGTSEDCNGNGIPDECEESCLISDPPDGEDSGACTTARDCCPHECGPVEEGCEPSLAMCLRGSCYTPKNRYISFVPPTDCGGQAAIRVTFADLPPSFDYAEGRTMWIGQPSEFCENSGQAGVPAGGCGSAPGIPSRSFWGATLGCSPYYTDWSQFDVVQVYYEGIVPSGGDHLVAGDYIPATYIIEAVSEGCNVSSEDDFSAPLTVRTSKWGDVVRNCQTCPCWFPNGLVQMVDVTAVLDKFMNLYCAPIKARCDLEPSQPDQIVNITDVNRTLEAFLGFGYPFDGPPANDPCQ